MGKKTAELTGIALDWAVGYVMGEKLRILERQIVWPEDYSPSTNWAQGGPIIEREGIAIDCLRLAGIIDGWVAALPSPTTWEDEEFVEEYCGTTPLIAAMRCYVASKLGDEVEIPDELK